MKFQLVITPEGASLALQPENEAERKILGVVMKTSPTCRATVKAAFAGHRSYGEVTSMAIMNFDPAPEEPV